MDIYGVLKRNLMSIHVQFQQKKGSLHNENEKATKDKRLNN